MGTPGTLEVSVRAAEVRRLKRTIARLTRVAEGMAAHLGIAEAYIQCVQNQVCPRDAREASRVLAYLDSVRADLFADTATMETKMELMRRLPEEHRHHFDHLMAAVADALEP